MNESKAQGFRLGMRDGIPIGLGYLAVAFSLGITARNAGLNAFQGFLISILNNASAGEYAGITVIAANAAYAEIAIVTLITNGHRLLMGFDITDELFGIAIARPGYLNPYYTYGAMLMAMPGWSIGTSLGIIAGNILPERVVSALSVALFGMFLAVIIPPARKNKVVAVLVALSFAASFAFSVLPLVNTLSDGTRTIILTVVISAGAALLFPVPREKPDVKSDFTESDAKKGASHS